MLILYLWIRSSFILGPSDLLLRNIFWFPSHYLVSRFNSPFLCPQLRGSPTFRHPSLGTVQGSLFNKRASSDTVLKYCKFPHFYIFWASTVRRKRKVKRTRRRERRRKWRREGGETESLGGRRREEKKKEKFNQLFVIPPSRTHTEHGWIRWVAITLIFSKRTAFGGSFFQPVIGSVSQRLSIQQWVNKLENESISRSMVFVLSHRPVHCFTLSWLNWLLLTKRHGLKMTSLCLVTWWVYYKTHSERKEKQHGFQTTLLPK